MRESTRKPRTTQSKRVDAGCARPRPPKREASTQRNRDPQWIENQRRAAAANAWGSKPC